MCSTRIRHRTAAWPKGSQTSQRQLCTRSRIRTVAGRRREQQASEQVSQEKPNKPLMSEEGGPEARPAEEVGGSALSVSGTASAWDPAAGSERGEGWPEHGTRLQGASAAEGGPSTLPRAGARSSRRAVRRGQARSRRGVCPARVQPSKGSLSLGAAERSAGEGRRVHSGRGPDSEQAWGNVLAKGALGLALPLCVVKQAWIWTITIKWRSPRKAVWQRLRSAPGPGDRLMGLRWATGSQYRLASHGPTRFPACPGCPAASGAVCPACKCGCRAPRRCRSRALASSGHRCKDGWRRTIRCTGIASAREEISTRRSRSLRARCCSRCHCSR